ncbi:hypothetical protein RHSIM_Rhsim06G0085300 [Rhododendron simsii]|uniref:Bifunctional inhibitor/plant lipid transfer protein/seed storage helical domain-containing protein n=1 Tax=Rhododendron simsii TaxID=118357 RepID=A0A834LHQ0_RHOSS|nr:hypothetical protein RHSIM_Rhsim06G0085300 [Rhododendron simsii]
MIMLKFSLVILATWVVVVAGNDAKPEDSSPVQSPEVAVDCSNLIYNMVDCVSFFSVGSNDTKPSFLCCLGFKVVLYMDAECICEGLKSSVALGIEIDMAKAATLPSACGASTPSISNCDANSPSANPPPETTPVPPLSSLVNKAPAPADSKWVLNQASAPSPIKYGAYATGYPSALYFILIMLVSFMF